MPASLAMGPSLAAFERPIWYDSIRFKSAI